MYESEVTNTATPDPIVFNWRTWAFLGIVVMALSSFGPTTIVAPVPLVFAFLIFGRARGFILGGVCFGLSTVLSLSYMNHFGAVGFLLFSLVIAIAISEIILRGIAPDRGLIIVGFFIFAFALGCIGIYMLWGQNMMKNYVNDFFVIRAESLMKEHADFIAKGGEQARMVEDLLKNPKKLVAEFFKWLPAMFFISMFLTVWFNFFIVLRGSMIWKRVRTYGFTLRHMLIFKTPDFCVWMLIGALAVILGGEFVLGTFSGTGHVIAMNILYCLGAYYFIQGFGIFYEFLFFLKISGFLRAMFLVVTVFFAFRVLVFVGLFDMWVNFRKFFKKINKNKGE